MISLHQMLTRQFGDGIAPTRFSSRPHRCRRILMHPEGVHAENLAGRKIKEALQPWALLQRLQNLQRADKIGLQGLARITAYAPHADNGGCMDHDVGLLREAAQRIGVQNVAFDLAYFRIVVERTEDNRLIVEEAVEKDDLVMFRQSLRQARS